MIKFPLWKPRIFKYLRFQIAAYYFLTSLIAVALLGTVLYVSISDLFLKEALSETISSVDDNGRLIDQYLDNLKTLSKVVAQDPDTIAFLKSDDQAARQRIMVRIQTILNSHSSVNSSELVKHTDQLEKEPWYALAMANMGMPVLTSIRRTDFTMDKSTWVISVGQEVLDENGQHLGVFLLDFSYKVIEEQLNNLNLGATGEAFILTVNNELVYHQNPAYFDSKALQDKLILICEMGTGYDKGMDKLTHHYQLKNADWLLVGMSSLDQMAVARRQIFETIMAIGIILLMIVLGSGVVIASSITKPINNLQKAMMAFSTDLETVTIEPANNLEIDQLSHRFSAMATNIQHLMKDIKEKERYLRESEIKVLYSQINPHFLYNTLDTIVWMAEFQDSDNVIAITKSLSKFFRISLSQGEDFIPLSQEFDHARQYLFIQSKRYSDKLTYNLELDPDASDILVPKILLQPLVENAIYHGIKPLGTKGLVTISAKLNFDPIKNSQCLIISITDNGVGFNQDALRQNQPNLGGVGLDNVKNRLSLIYANQSTFNIISEPGKGTQIFITLYL